jgi:RHS repeat-associated protein
MQMPGRDTTFKTGYRYGFNGKEMDNDTYGGQGNEYDFGVRIYNPRTGRWFSTDLHEKAYLSPYQFGRNNPVDIVDPDGNDEFHFHYLTTYSQVRTLGADGNFQTSYRPTTHTYVEVVKNNLANTFYVHRDIARTSGNGLSSSTTTQFFPDAGAGMIRHSGVTTFGVFNRSDDDYTSLLKVLDDFPEMKKDLQGLISMLQVQETLTGIFGIKLMQIKVQEPLLKKNKNKLIA